MIRRLLKAAGIGLLAVVVLGAVLYSLGLRVVLDGGGSPYLAFTASERARADAIEKHRSAQRAQAPPAAVPRAGTRDTAPAAVPPSGEKSSGTPEVRPTLASAPASTEVRLKPDAAPGGLWSDFRGPRRDGHYTERPIRTSWPSGGLTPIWKEPVGAGYASVVMARGRGFTIEQRGSEEVVAAYDIVSGRELWTNRWSAKFSEMMGGDGPRATPTWFDGRVYALGAAGELRCLEEGDGRVVWRTNILDDAGATNVQWGMSAAPLIVDGTVVVLPGGPNDRSVVAYDRRTGKIAWSAHRDRAAYSSPMLAEVAGVRQLLVFTASRLMGLTPDRGELLWEYPWTTQFDVNASQPLLIGSNRIFVSTGYGTGAALIELTNSGGRLSLREVWRSNRMKNQFTSSVLHDGYIYGLDESILACIDAATGELKWKGGRYGYGQVMLASGHLIVLTEDGQLALVRATPEEHQEIARFDALDGKTWNHPAMADGYLVVRNVNEMAAFDLRGR